ncbi:MAG: FdtA/QdtA family cupin domain-containing protein [Alphaproteobacteria bacterium]|nr:FdtA/QdtA family cupin domain-containing protein [Alphaproteobacteria bacterium]
MGRRPESVNSGVRGTAKLVELPSIEDPRGCLSVAEVGGVLPFVPHRLYWMHSAERNTIRGGHAHRQLEQLIIAMFGAFEIEVDNGLQKRTFVLEHPQLGLLLYPILWRDIRQLTPSGTLAVLASHSYDEQDYIREKDEFYIELTKLAL